MNDNILLKVENLDIKFNSDEVIKNLNFSVNQGDVLAVVGPNGAGKSVLFRALLGLIPYSGKIKWNENLKISYIPQKFAIDRELPLSAEEFLSFKKKSQKEIIDVLVSVGVGAEHRNEPAHQLRHITDHVLKQRLGWLSGGQLQRVLIAWALLDNPDVLLFDEPTSGIDVGGEETIYSMLKKLHSERKLTMLLISHDLNIVYRYANNVLCLNKEMICYGSPATALDSSALVKLYGDEAGFYKHEDHHH
ncbi:MAG: metal ABC transporter ATP-binding protein [Candidatus Yanofskybacteria bacterium]|nr:metal ABC transporter ATP-binding protein [Candidatus Yanofskybacteria bacterium]